MIKIGGEALLDSGDFGIDFKEALKIAERLKGIKDAGYEIMIVMGGGNLWRGAEHVKEGINRVTADEVGMLGTVMNCLALRDALEQAGIEARLHTSLNMSPLTERYSRKRALHQLEKGYVVIIGAGTGHPFFTTDTAAALRALELDADVLIKATKVDGIYSEDPEENENARLLDKLTYLEAINKDIGVMDKTAVTVCMNEGLPIIICNLKKPGCLEDVLKGKKVGSLVAAEGFER